MATHLPERAGQDANLLVGEGGHVDERQYRLQLLAHLDAVGQHPCLLGAAVYFLKIAFDGFDELASLRFIERVMR